MKNYYLVSNQDYVCDFCYKDVVEVGCIKIIHESGEIVMCKTCVKELYQISKLIKKRKEKTRNETHPSLASASERTCRIRF